jgi:hypothetical protein
VARFDGAAAQQDAILPFRDATHDHLGVVVMDGPATGANKARKIVAWRHTVFDAGTAVAAEFHGFRK